MFLSGEIDKNKQLCEASGTHIHRNGYHKFSFQKTNASSFDVVINLDKLILFTLGQVVQYGKPQTIHYGVIARIAPHKNVLSVWLFGFDLETKTTNNTITVKRTSEIRIDTNFRDIIALTIEQQEILTSPNNTHTHVKQEQNPPLTPKTHATRSVTKLEDTSPTLQPTNNKKRKAEPQPNIKKKKQQTKQKAEHLIEPQQTPKINEQLEQRTETLEKELSVLKSLLPQTTLQAATHSPLSYPPTIPTLQAATHSLPLSYPPTIPTIPILPQPFGLQPNVFPYAFPPTICVKCGNQVPTRFCGNCGLQRY